MWAEEIDNCKIFHQFKRNCGIFDCIFYFVYFNRSLNLPLLKSESIWGKNKFMEPQKVVKFSRKISIDKWWRLVPSSIRSSDQSAFQANSVSNNDRSYWCKFQLDITPATLEMDMLPIYLMVLISTYWVTGKMSQLRIRWMKQWNDGVACTIKINPQSLTKYLQF